MLRRMSELRFRRYEFDYQLDLELFRRNGLIFILSSSTSGRRQLPLRWEAGFHTPPGLQPSISACRCLPRVATGSGHVTCVSQI
jgi:hypothetical protein